MTEETLKELGERISSLRKKKFPDDDPKDFSKRIRVSFATYQRIEKGDMNIPLKEYYKTAIALGCEHSFKNLFF